MEYLSLILHESSVSFCRDDLYRVELDNMAGDEMFYSKVRISPSAKKHKRSNTNTVKIFLTASFLLQKRTWESNKNDIRVCRMKGKHEVKASPTAVKLLDPFFTWIKTITRMGGANSCQRYLISFGCACLRVFTQI